MNRPLRHKAKPKRLMPDLWLFQDACNVFVIRRGDAGVAIDFGSGRWLAGLSRLGIRRLDHVLLTHHHADQCAGLSRRKARPFNIHAPAGSDQWLDRNNYQTYVNRRKRLPYYAYPDFELLPGGLADVRYDLRPNSEFFWRGLCFRFVHTPGHGPSACSIMVELNGRQLAFCGDAVHAGGTIWRPYNLEWDHWTGAGALAAWEGVQRLSGIGLDYLCPSHGPIVTRAIPMTLRKLADRLMAFYAAKGSICAGEKDRFLVPEIMPDGSRRILPHLYQFGGNGYLLVSKSKQAFVVDPCSSDMPALEALLKTLKTVRPTACAASHYHADHCDGIPLLQRKYGTKACLHPCLVPVLLHKDGRQHFCLPRRIIRADVLWPERGIWQWQEFQFRVAHWPGQTWWHCVFMSTIDGRKVMFGGDSFQPASRWNGTGGFCAYNRSRFRQGYIPSARLAIRWRPDIMANGHRCCYQATRSRFDRIRQWAGKAEQAVRALCPSGRLETDYYFEGPRLD